MKIKLNDYAGLVFTNPTSWLSLEITRRAWGVIDNNPIGTVVHGTLITNQLQEGRRAYVNVLMSTKGYTHYLLTEQAQKVAHASIKVDKKFNWRLLNTLRPQASCYLLNSNEFIRFVSTEDGVVILQVKAERDKQGEINNYTTRLMQIDWEAGILMAKGMEPEHIEIAHILARLIIFIELSEPEIMLVEAHADSPNRKAPLNDRIENKTNVPITRVHSSWNKYVIRVSDIGVRAFQRLQACGPNWSQRKLTWVKAHTRNGFKRRNKGGASL